MSCFLIIMRSSSFVIMGKCNHNGVYDLQLDRIPYPTWNLPNSVYVTNHLGNNLGIIGNGIKFFGTCDAILYTGSAT